MRLKMLPLKQLDISGFQRRHINDNLSALKSSVWSNGIIYPILVTKKDADYYVVDGKRRCIACRELNLGAGFKIPALIINANTTKSLQLNLQANTLRKDFSSLEQAEISNILINKYDKQPREVAANLGVSKAYINKILKIFALPKEMIASARRGDITFSHALWLTKLLSDSDKLNFCYRRLLKDKLSIRDLETLISSLRRSKNDRDNYRFFSPKVITTKAGSRIRFEPRRRSLRIELNLKKDEPLEAIFKALRDNIDDLLKDKLKAVS